MDALDAHMRALAHGRAEVTVRTPERMRRATLLAWAVPGGDGRWRGRRALVQFPEGRTRHVHQRDVLIGGDL